MRPFKTSLIVSGLYIVICSLYIWLSGLIAVRISNSVISLQSIELFKGLLFVLITGSICFFFVYQLLLRIQNQNKELEIQRKALVDLQARTLSGTIAAGIAHDINNVICSVDFDINELLDVVPDSKKAHIERISKSYTKIVEMASRLQSIGKVRTEISLKSIDLCELIRQTIDFAMIHRRIKPCDIQFEEHNAIYLKINPELIEQMLINLMINAADATESKGKIKICLIKNLNHVCIEVHDNGPGVKEENRDNLFRPYFTTKPHGTGLGLATVKTCAELHGGSVIVESSYLGGALFKIVLPLLT